MILVIDTTGTADSLFFDQLTQLDGREYLLRFLWSDREICWYLNVYDQDEAPLALAIKLVIGWPLLRRFHDPRLPPGMLVVRDLSGTDQEIAEPSELQPEARCQLYYVTADDEDIA